MPPVIDGSPTMPTYGCLEAGGESRQFDEGVTTDDGDDDDGGDSTLMVRRCGLRIVPSK